MRFFFLKNKILILRQFLNLISGGQIGLFFGASLVTLIELLFILISNCITSINYLNEKHKYNLKNKNNSNLVIEFNAKNQIINLK